MNDKTSIHLLVLQMHYALPRVVFGAKFNRLLHTVLFDVMVLCSLAQNVLLGSRKTTWPTPIYITYNLHVRNH